ncbi:MAG: hypothetical protein AAF351_03235 [Pseudomonadota bacterium]
MKPLTLAICLFLCAATSSAEPLCTNWEFEREPEYQFRESDFTLEAAQRSIAYLEERVLAAEHDLLSTFAEYNALTLLKGWLLKKSALAARENGQGEDEVYAFCRFLDDDGVIYD